MVQKKAIITGILGQDGSYLAELLHSKGYEVFGFTSENSLRSSSDKSKKALLFNFCKIFTDDITSTKNVISAVKNIMPDEIYHFAACHHSSQEGYKENLNNRMMEVNFKSTYNILTAIHLNKPDCKFIYAGSSQIYTPVEKITVVNESTLPDPSTFYGETKLLSKELISYYRKRYGLFACTAILFNHESPRRDNNYLSRKITQTAVAIKKGLTDKLQLFDVSIKVDWSSALDIVNAAYLMLGAQNPKDYILSSNKLHSVKDFLDITFNYLGLDWKKYVEEVDIKKDKKYLLGDNSLAIKELPWVPAVTFQDMIIDMIEEDKKNLI
jgi:GDPmannose 4,6-dehydratase